MSRKHQMANVRGARKLEREWFRRQDQLRKKAEKRAKEQRDQQTINPAKA